MVINLRLMSKTSVIVTKERRLDEDLYCSQTKLPSCGCLYSWCYACGYMPVHLILHNDPSEVWWNKRFISKIRTHQLHTAWNQEIFLIFLGLSAINQSVNICIFNTHKLQFAVHNWLLIEIEHEQWNHWFLSNVLLRNHRMLGSRLTARGWKNSWHSLILNPNHYTHQHKFNLNLAILHVWDRMGRDRRLIGAKPER